MQFQDPKHTWSATIGGISVLPGTMLTQGREVSIKVQTMCGDECADATVSVMHDMTVVEAARRMQLAASIQHVTRRACTKCRNQYQYGTSHDEKKWLVSQEPKLGPIVGMDTRGEFGEPMGPVVPENIGETDQSTLDTFRREKESQQEEIRSILARNGSH